MNEQHKEDVRVLTRLSCQLTTGGCLRPNEKQALGNAIAALSTQPQQETVTAWPKSIHDEALEVMRNIDTQFRATGRPIDRLQRLINLIAGMPSQPRPDEFTEKHGTDLRGIKVGEPLTQEQWDSVTAFVREQDRIIDAYKEQARPASAPVGAKGPEYSWGADGSVLADFTGDPGYT